MASTRSSMTNAFETPEPQFPLPSSPYDPEPQFPLPTSTSDSELQRLERQLWPVPRPNETPEPQLLPVLPPVENRERPLLQFYRYLDWHRNLKIFLFALLVLAASVALNFETLPSTLVNVTTDTAQQLPPVESLSNESDPAPPAVDVNPGLSLLHTLEGVVISWYDAEEPTSPSEDVWSDPENHTKPNDTEPWTQEEVLLKSPPLETPTLPRSGEKCCKPPVCCDLETPTTCYRKCQGDYILALVSGPPVCPSRLPLEALLVACNATVGPKQMNDDCGVLGTLKTAWHTLMCLAPFWTMSVVFLTVLLLCTSIKMLVSRVVLRYCRPGLWSRLKDTLESKRKRLEVARTNTSAQDVPKETKETPLDVEMLLKQDIEDMAHFNAPEPTRPDQRNLSYGAPEGYRFSPAGSEEQTSVRASEIESFELGSSEIGSSSKGGYSGASSNGGYSGPFSNEGYSGPFSNEGYSGSFSNEGYSEFSENSDNTPSRPAVRELKKRFEGYGPYPLDEELGHFQPVQSALRKSDADDEGLEEDSADLETYDEEMDDYLDEDEYLQMEDGDDDESDFNSSADSSGEEMKIENIEKVRADLAKLRKELEKQPPISSPSPDPHRVVLGPLPKRSN